VVLVFILALVWAKRRDPFERIEFSLKTAQGGKVKGIALLPKPVAQHPVAIYLHGSGGSMLGSGAELRQFAELGLAAVGLEYNQTNQTSFDEPFIALQNYLAQQSWVHTNATAWIGSSLGAQRILSFASRHPEIQPQLLVCMGGGWVAELDDSKVQGPKPKVQCPVLLVNGEKDEVFPMKGSQQLAEVLRSNRTSVEVRVLPHLEHGFGEERATIERAVAEYCRAHLPMADYAAALPRSQLTKAERKRFNAAMQRAGEHRRELWRAVCWSGEPERHTVMNVIGGLEDYDLAHVSALQLRKTVNAAWKSRRTYLWCRDTPLDIFEKLTTNLRIYEEPLAKLPFPLVRVPLPRVKYCHDTGEASDAVGAWLYSHMRFRTAPQGSESTLREMLNEKAACREAAMMYTYLGRSIGLAMRPAYTIWPTLGSWHWFSEVWSVEEKQWHPVDSANQDRRYHTSWVLRVPKSSVLSTTGERGGWNALNEQRWEQFTNTVGLFYPSGQVVVRVLDGERPLKDQRVVAQTWLNKEVLSVMAARTDDNGEVRLTLGESAVYPYRILIDRSRESDWEWVTVRSNSMGSVTLDVGKTKPFDKTIEPQRLSLGEKGS
jgi:dienelactone hydrolase